MAAGLGGSDQEQPLMLYIVSAATILVVLIVITFIRRKYSVNDEATLDVRGTEIEAEGEASPQAVRRILPPADQVRRVGGSRTVRSRLRNRTSAQDAASSHPVIDEDDSGGPDLDDDDDDNDDVDKESINFPGGQGKIGAKKRKKLEMKAEKKAIREQELQEREERKKRQELLDEQRKKADELAKIEEAKRVEQERIEKEEKERQEREAYQKMKETFAIESEGFDRDIGEDEADDLLKQFTQHVKAKKVVYLEDLASRFQLKTLEAIDRLNSLLKSGDLTGVFDDRGKFIYISMDELESVAKFIKQRGRVTITELAECSNQLINMNPIDDEQESQCSDS